jgi:glycosyltransferase involved in cell wall biosynthesis
MNILYVSAKKGWGGIITWMYRTALGLEARGHNVWIVSHPDSPFTKTGPPGVRIIAKRLGMDCNPAMILFLVSFIRRRRIDLVVTNIQKEVLIGGLAARICRIPNVRMVGNENDLNDRIRWRQRLLVDHTIVPSDATLRNAMKRAGWLEPQQFTTIYTGRNPITYSKDEIAAERSRWGLSERDLVVGTTARLAEIKGIDSLISVFKTVAAKHANWYLVITGDGPDREKLEALAASLGIQDRVVFAGFSAEAAKAAAAYDIAVLNSSIEGFPNVIVEYLAAGKPVISTDVGGIPEIIRDGENGVLVRPGDDRDLLDKMLRLVENPDLRQRLGRSGIETVTKGFSEDIMVDRTETLFERVARERR